MYIIDYFWRPKGTKSLKVGRILSADPEQLEAQAQKTMKGERGSISAIRGPFLDEYIAQIQPSPFFGLTSNW